MQALPPSVDLTAPKECAAVWQHLSIFAEALHTDRKKLLRLQSERSPWPCLAPSSICSNLPGACWQSQQLHEGRALLLPI